MPRAPALHLLPPSTWLLSFSPAPALCCCLPGSLCLPESLDLCLSGPGSSPGAGLCKCGISCLIIGLPAWLTFNSIRGSTSVEPLVKAGRQLGACQGGLGPGGDKGRGLGPCGVGRGLGCNPQLPQGLSELSAKPVGWPKPACPVKTGLPSAQDRKLRGHVWGSTQRQSLAEPPPGPQATGSKGPGHLRDHSKVHPWAGWVWERVPALGWLRVP